MQPNNGLLTLEAANMYCGGSGSGNESNHIRLVNVKLPAMEEQYLDHRPGGAPIAVEVDVMINKLMCEFTLAGWTVHVAELLDAWQQQQQQFWFYGALRERLTGNIYQAQAYIVGRLGRADMQAWQRGQINGYDYALRGIIAYTLSVADETVYDWDFFRNEFSVGQAIGTAA